MSALSLAMCPIATAAPSRTTYSAPMEQKVYHGRTETNGLFRFAESITIFCTVWTKQNSLRIRAKATNP